MEILGNRISFVANLGKIVSLQSVFADYRIYKNIENDDEKNNRY